MAVLIRSGADLAEDEKRRRGQIPLWVPSGAAQEFERRRILRLLAQQKAQSEAEEELERLTPDARPFAFTDNSVPGRPVTVIGGGAMYRGDMKDMAKRVLEKPDPKTDPKWRERANLSKAIDQRDELIKNLRRGRSSIFHFASNPIFKETKR